MVRYSSLVPRHQSLFPLLSIIHFETLRKGAQKIEYVEIKHARMYVLRMIRRVLTLKTNEDAPLR